MVYVISFISNDSILREFAYHVENDKILLVFVVVDLENYDSAGVIFCPMATTISRTSGSLGGGVNSALLSDPF